VTWSKSEPTLYFKKQVDDILFVCLYVDDLIYVGSSSNLNDSFMDTMMSEFEMKDLGLMHYFLGMEVHRSKDKIFICQTKYAKDMLKNYDMDGCKLVPTPIAHGELICKDDKAEKVNVTNYRSIVGSLMFLTNNKPDIAYDISFVSRYMSEPSSLHLKATKRILRYVKGVVVFGIHYFPIKEVELVGFSDLGWGSNLDDRIIFLLDLD